MRINDRGISVIHEGDAAVADIVFIHGLQGHPERTWRYGPLPSQMKSSGKVSKLFHLRSKSTAGSASSETGCFWPELLAKRFKNVRVATYGYDSRVTNFFGGAANQMDVIGHGRSLLNSLETFRSHEPRRPLLFVVHSLGGLVLKEALRRSWQAQIYENDLRTVYYSTVAILFMGTPHRGSQYADWGIIARNVAVASGFDASDRILRNLQPDAGHLDILCEDFSKMLLEDSFDIFTFMESKPLKATRRKVRLPLCNAMFLLNPACPTGCGRYFVKRELRQRTKRLHKRRSQGNVPICLSRR